MKNIIRRQFPEEEVNRLIECARTTSLDTPLYSALISLLFYCSYMYGFETFWQGLSQREKAYLYLLSPFDRIIDLVRPTLDYYLEETHDVSGLEFAIDPDDFIGFVEGLYPLGWAEQDKEYPSFCHLNPHLVQGIRGKRSHDMDLLNRGFYHHYKDYAGFLYVNWQSKQEDDWVVSDTIIGKEYTNFLHASFIAVRKRKSGLTLRAALERYYRSISRLDLYLGVCLLLMDQLPSLNGADSPDQDFVSGWISLHDSIARHYKLQEEFDLAEKHYQSSLALCKKYLADFPELSRTLVLLTQNRTRMMTSIPQQIEVLRETYQLLTHPDDKIFQLDVAYNLAESLRINRELEAAKDLLIQTSKEEILEDLPLQRIRLLGGLGSIFRDMLEPGKSIDCIQEGLSLALVYGNAASQGQMYLHLARWFYDDGDWERSFELAKGAMELLTTAQDHATAGEVFDLLASISYKKQNYDDAFDYLNQAGEIFAEYGDIYSLGMAFHDIAGLCYEIEFFEDAGHYWSEALVAFEQVGVAYLLGQAHANLGNVQTVLGSFLEAEKHYSQSQRFFLEIDAQEELTKLEKLIYNWEQGSGEKFNS